MSLKTWMFVGAVAVLAQACSVSQGGTVGVDPKAGQKYNGTAMDLPSSVDPGQPGGSSARSTTSGMSNSKTYVPPTRYSAHGLTDTSGRPTPTQEQ